eukprot:1161792-Pelagomonas_calceolata.AAC.1
MLDRLHGYAQRKGLTINVLKSEVVHFKSMGNNIPIFTLGGAQLVRAESFKQLTCDYKLANRPHTMLWLTMVLACQAAKPGLDRRNSFAQCIYSGQQIKDFVIYLWKRRVWPTEDQADHDGHPNKIAKNHNWVALPFRHNSAFGKPLRVTRYLYLKLGRHMQQNIANFRLHAHKLRVAKLLFGKGIHLSMRYVGRGNFPTTIKEEETRWPRRAVSPLHHKATKQKALVGIWDDWDLRDLEN